MGPALDLVTEDEDMGTGLAYNNVTFSDESQECSCIDSELGSFSSETASPGIGKPPVISCHLLLRLIDDALVMLRSLCYLSDNFLADLDKFRDNFPPEHFEQLQSHANAATKWRLAENPEAEQRLSNSARARCHYFLKRRSSALKAVQVQAKVPVPGHIFLLESLQKFRAVALKRLSTALDEQESIDGYREDIEFRQEKAIKENTVLHQQLEADRQVRADAFAKYQEDEQMIYQDCEMSKAQALSLDKQLESDCAALEESEAYVFHEEYDGLIGENEKLRGELADNQLKDREKELQLRGKKGQSYEEVSDLLWVYEADIAERTSTLAELREESNEVDQKLKKMEAYFAEKERLKQIQEEEERLRIEAICANKRKKWLPFYAVCRIQRYWKAYIKRKHAAQEPEGGKEKKGKKGGKKGGKKKK